MDAAWSLIQKGGITMVPLLLCSVLGLAVVIDRIWALRRPRVLAGPLVDLVRRYAPGSQDWRQVTSRHPGAFAEVIRALVDDPPPARSGAVEKVHAAGRRAVKQLDRGLVVLEIVAGISPLLGLFGTVLGMFDTFQVIAEQGLGEASALSGGISEALITTIVGLGIGIPALVAHSFFNKRVEDLVFEMEDLSTTLLERLYPDGEHLRMPSAEEAG